MLRALSVAAAFYVLCAVTALALDDLPKRASSDPLDFEGPLLLDEPPETPAAVRTPDIAQLETKLGQAKKRADWNQRLYQRGIVAKVDAEKRTLEVVRITSELETARLEAAKAHAAAVRNAGGKAEVEEADAAVAAATLAAVEAAAKRRTAEIDAAAVDLQRKRKLVAAGIGSKAQVKRAEEKLAALQSEER